MLGVFSGGEGARRRSAARGDHHHRYARPPGEFRRHGHGDVTARLRRGPYFGAAIAAHHAAAAASCRRADGMITWYAAYTQPHAEAKALDHLQRQGYSIYLPRYRRWVRHPRKRALVSRPLFPRYLFAGLDRLTQRWRPIRSTAGVVGVVTSGDAPVPVAPDIIDALRPRESEGAVDMLSLAPQF